MMTHTTVTVRHHSENVTASHPLPVNSARIGVPARSRVAAGRSPLAPVCNTGATS